MPDANPESPPLKDYRLMLARQATDDVSSAQPIGCMVCPCDKGWSIVTVCPCNDCNQFPWAFMGARIPAGDEPPYFVQATYEGRTTHLYVYDISYSAPIDWGTTNGHVGNSEFNVIQVPIGIVLWAISHKTPAAPFASDVEVRLLIDGVYAGGWEGEAGNGEQVDIGDGDVVGISQPVACVPIEHIFSESGFHTLDLKVVFAGTEGQGTWGYTVRYIVRVGPKNDTINWLGEVGIVPEDMVFDDCGHSFLRLEQGSDSVAAYLSLLKGPFDNREDAQIVLDTWSGLIAAYASTCVCEPECVAGSLIADAIKEFDGRHILTRLAAGDDAEYTCEDGWAEYDVTDANENFQLDFPNMSIAPWFYTADGRWVPAGNTGIIAPCDKLLFVVSGGEVGGLGMTVGSLGNVNPLTTADVCCLEDEESPFYEAAWDYDTGTHEGVPNSTAELADYLESISV